ncbi:GLPGLI family protein [Winogradskyella sp. Asnod2-B02-A]|uniref:GLPGLI family protein n=1 Tax=Winogradskyella sp. Asnod2-B02-A TaxID=3160583 RepID=UPI00387071BE
MIKTKFIIFLTLVLGILAQAQSNLSGTVLYKASHNKTKIKKDSGEKSEGIEGANQLLQNASDVYTTLNFNSKESSYRVNKKLKVDGIDSINITYFFAGGDNLFYCNNDSLKVVQSNTSLGKLYLIKKDSPNWVITKETKMIDGLTCTKAYSTILEGDKEKVGATAWFCPSIPVGFGPLEYFGLPGLIIELQFSKMTFIAEKINLNKKNVVIEKHKNAPILTLEEFMAIAKKRTPDFFEN